MKIKNKILFCTYITCLVQLAIYRTNQNRFPENLKPM